MEVLVQGLLEKVVGIGDLGKQGHRGMKLQVVGMTENPRYRALPDVQHFLGAGTQPGAQQRMIKVGQGFLPRADGKAARHLAVAESGKLRKNEPHPVTTLVSVVQLVLNPVEYRVLSLEKTLQIERVQVVGASHGEAL
ncbi:hypothetical protein D9M69_520660 [compost metagenome]